MKLSSRVASAVCTRIRNYSWRQFRRVVDVNTPVGSRDQNCKLAANGCVVRSNPSAVVANSCTRRRDATKQFRRRRRCVLGLRRRAAAAAVVMMLYSN